MKRACSALLALTTAAVAAGACRSRETPSTGALPPREGALRTGVVARVGEVEILAESVARIAAAQGIGAREARDLAVRDALFASEARAGWFDRGPARVAIRGALARLALRDILAEAMRAGPVTDDELRDATARRWLELDRPPGFRTVHAVVRLDENADGTRRERALAIAEAVLRAVASVVSADPAPPPAGASDPLVESFREAARTVPHEGFELIVEPLPPLAADGRVLEPGGRELDTDYARAASLLVERGEVGPPAVSRFGVHVIMLLERLPASGVPVEERRRLVRDEVVAGRARAVQNRLLEGMRQDSTIDHGVDAQLALVPVGQ